MTEPKNVIPLIHDGALTDDSWEIARVWVTHNEGSHVWISAWALDGAKNFGHLMVDTIRHGAAAYAQHTGVPFEQALQAILGSVMGDLQAEFAKVERVTPRDAA